MIEPETVPLERYVDTGDLRIHFAELANDNPAMVLLHGIGMDWRVWQSVARRLQRYFYLYMPDLRGHGLSDKPRSGYSLADYASDIEQLIHQLQLRDVSIVGSSLGGMVAIAMEAPVTVIARRVLVDPPLVRGSGPQRPLFERILEIKMASQDAHEQKRQIYLALKDRADTTGGAGNIFVRYMAQAWTATAPGVLQEALDPIERPDDIAAALRAIESSVLIMRGNRDKGGVLDEGDAQRAIDLLLHGQQQYFADSGHAIHGSEPDVFVQSIVEFAAAGVGLHA